MTSKRYIAALVCAGTLLAEAACAAPDVTGFSGLVDGGFIYARVRSDGKVLDSDQYVGQGDVLYTFDNPGMAVQLDVSDDFYDAVKFQLAHIWSGGGSAFWRDDKGTIGFSGSYFATDAPAEPLFSGKKSLESYGVFGEYYIFKSLTLQARGGGTEGGGVGLQSYYGAAGLTWYDDPDLAVHAEYNYTTYSSGHNWTGIEGEVEYLPFHSVPVSLYVGYDYANISKADNNGGDSAAIYFGLKLHLGSGLTLRDYQRTGPIEWTGDSRPGANLKF